MDEEVLTVDDLFDLADEDYADHVEQHLLHPAGSPQWEALASNRLIKRTKGVIGRMIRDDQAEIGRRRRAAGQDKASNLQWYRQWKEDTTPRRDALHAWGAYLKDLQLLRHEEMLKAQSNRPPRPIVQIQPAALPDGYPFWKPAHTLLRSLVGAIQWHRRSLLEQNLSPGPADLKLWRSILRLRQLADGEGQGSLDEHWGSSKVEPIEWPDDFIPTWDDPDQQPDPPGTKEPDRE